MLSLGTVDTITPTARRTKMKRMIKTKKRTVRKIVLSAQWC